MRAVMLKPRKQQLDLQLLGLVALGVATVLMPQSSVVLVWFMPLFSCLLAGHPQQWLALAASLAPAASCFTAGWHPLLCACMLLAPVLPFVAAVVLRKRTKTASAQAFAWFMGAYALGLLCFAACGAYLLQGDLATRLADLVVDAVSASRQKSAILYNLAHSGLVSVPPQYASAGLLAYTVDVGLHRQLLLSLHYTVRTLAQSLLPGMFTSVSIIGGLFCALRAQRFNCTLLLVTGDPAKPDTRKTIVMMSPGFSRMKLPPYLRTPMLWLAVAALVLLLIDHPLPQTMGQLCYGVFECIFQLLGASVLLGVLMASHPQRRVLYGVLAGLLYVFVPFALFMLGVCDPFLNLRSRFGNDPQQQPNNDINVKEE